MNKLPNFLSLFKETKFLAENKKKGKGIFKDIVLPYQEYPKVNSSNHKKDINAVMFYLENKSLSEKFLNISHDSCKDIFKDFCKKNNLKVNWQKIKIPLKDFNNVIFHLKNKYRRERPKEYIKNLDPSLAAEIKNMNSFSFPSGHTGSAYFIAGMLSKLYPNYSTNFEDIAELIGQSRIENGVHYPSDVNYGRMLGEYCSDYIFNKDDFNYEHKDIKKKDRKKLINFLFAQNQNKKNLLYDMVDFITLTNQIEGIHINQKECISACKKFLQGYDLESISKDDNIITQIKMIVNAFRLGNLDCIGKFQIIHSNFNRSQIGGSTPSSIRNYTGHSSFGNTYSSPEDIYRHCRQLRHIKNPFIKHIAFEWIHPFEDGNGRTGRIILLSDLDFDFSKANSFISSNYIENIQSFISTNKNIDNILL